MTPSTSVEPSPTASPMPPSDRKPVDDVLFCLPSMDADCLNEMLTALQAAFPGEKPIVALPEHVAGVANSSGSLQIMAYATPRADLGWVLAARDYVTAAQMAAQHGMTHVVLLGADATSLSTQALRTCVDELRGGADLALPRYEVGPYEALVNTALLYPMTRALFGLPVHFPLALDAGMSQRMAQRLSVVGARYTSLGQADALVWPAAEAATAGFRLGEFPAGKRRFPQPETADFNALFASVAGSLFADVESKAALWQRTRPPAAPTPSDPGTRAASAVPPDVRELVAGYSLAFRNLMEVWALVLPPQSLLALKKLSLAPAEQFHFPGSLWARVVYDFALAFRMRTLNRGHLLGAFRPLYLAWVASALLASEESSANTARLMEENALAFEREKPYLVARWRWPDRFNP